MRMKKSRFIAAFLAALMLFTMLPFSSLAAPAADIPKEMLDNPYLDALAYTGYKVQALKDNGQIFKKYGSSLSSSYLSGITYDDSYTCSGLETNSSGKPDIAKFKSAGFCCASYVSYVYLNYLPNVAGIDVSKMIHPSNYRSASSWSAAADQWVSKGLGKRISFSQSSDGSNFVANETIPIGSLVVFKNISSGRIAHVGIYAGQYNNHHYITHVGNDRGPEIMTIDGMTKGGSAEAVTQIVTPPIIVDNGLIQVYKKDTNGKNLSGAVFVATNNSTGVQYKIGPTNSEGYAATSERIPYGSYKVKETVFPTNYRSHGQSEWNITVSSQNNGVVTINAVNEIIPGACQIVKTSEDGKVDGISFHVTGNGVDTTVQTKNGGKIQIDNLVPGVYSVEELSIEKYVPQSKQSVTVVSGKTATVTFNNTLKRGSITVTKTAEDGLEEGMRFHLYGTSLSGLTVDEYAVVGTDKKAHFNNVLIGSGYVLEEVGTEYRYITPEAQNVNVEWNTVTNASFQNLLKRGNLTVTKTAEDGLTEGIRFHLYGMSISGIPVDEYASVEADGKAYFRNILIGSGYTVEEVDTNIKYVIPEKQFAEIAWNTVTEKTFHNALKKWNLTVVKSDSETGSPQGDASLAGAVYGIYKDNELIDSYTTDANGRFTTKWYVCGSGWELRELSASEGYLVNVQGQKIGAEPKNYTVEYNPLDMDSLETVRKAKISVIKHTDDGSTQLETPELGAEFEIYLKSAGSYAAAKDTERDILVCDENGFAISRDLPYGVYVVKQTKGWDGREKLKPFDVYINHDGEIYRYLINNEAFRSYIKIIKTDAETGKIIPYAGAAFQLYRPDGSRVSMTYTYPEVTTIDTFYTNEDGYLITPEKLEYGLHYSLVEVQAPYGYVLNRDPVFFDITEENSSEHKDVTVVAVNRPNMPQKGTITVSKTGEVFSTVTKSSNVYQPVYEVKGIAGAIYEIIAAEDIYTPDGTLRYAKGTVVDTITTGTDGNAVSKPIYLGHYEVREITAPPGMVLNEEIRTVVLSYAGQDVAITETATSFYNERQKVQIDLLKVMEQDDTFDIGFKDEILSVQFGLFAAEDLTAADGSMIPKDALLEIVGCSENGYILFSTDLPVGARLYIQEIATNETYVLDRTKYPVVFDYHGQNTALVHIAVNDGNPIENEIIRGNIVGHKTDRETGENITGALFGLFYADETEFTQDTAILTAETTDGIFLFENIPFGDWIVAELMPAENYLSNSERYPITVSKQDEVIEISVINDRIPEIGTTASTEGEQQTHPDKTITIDDIVEYKHLIPGKEYTVKGILMDKATGEAFLVDGQPVTSETTFIPEDFSGIVTVTFVFDGTGITQNTDLVVFEGLYKDGIELAVHADIDDEGQTVTVLVPEIGTAASVDGQKEVNATEVFTLTDTVRYENLILGRTYTLKGVLMDKATDKPLLLNGEEIRSEVTFVPETADGEMAVPYLFDSKYITAETDIVVYEKLFYGENELAVHENIEDRDQTVTVHVPEIGTQASVNGKKEVKAKGEITLTDMVS